MYCVPLQEEGAGRGAEVGSKRRRTLQWQSGWQSDDHDSDSGEQGKEKEVSWVHDVILDSDAHVTPLQRRTRRHSLPGEGEADHFPRSPPRVPSGSNKRRLVSSSQRRLLSSGVRRLLDLE